MEYKGFKYTVVQTANPTGWKWTVWLDEGRSKMGNAFSRASAITFAQHAIEKIIKKRVRCPTSPMHVPGGGGVTPPSQNQKARLDHYTADPDVPFQELLARGACRRH
jgi:hypothetical protein